jgi:hypothetical protein
MPFELVMHRASGDNAREVVAHFFHDKTLAVLTSANAWDRFRQQRFPV